MIETPPAIFNVRAIAAAAKDAETRLAGFVLGLNDLAKETRARQVRGRAPMLPWIATCILAAREYGIDILDGVYNDIANTEGFKAECEQARDMGFDGKTLIHPNQIEPCNAVFSPTDDEVTISAQDDRGVRHAGEPAARAWCRSTAAWSSACMPKWRAALSQSPTRSRRAGSASTLRLNTTRRNKQYDAPPTLQAAGANMTIKRIGKPLRALPLIDSPFLTGVFPLSQPRCRDRAQSQTTCARRASRSSIFPTRHPAPCDDIIARHAPSARAARRLACRQ